MADTDPLVIAIAGPNGAGKTTLAPFLLRNHFGLTEYVNADTIALGLSAFRPEAAAFEAARIMLKRIRALATAEARVTSSIHTSLWPTRGWCMIILSPGTQLK